MSISIISDVLTKLYDLFKKELKKKDSLEPIYYNITLNNGYQSVNDFDRQFRSSFSELNNSNIINESYNWFVAVMRLSLPSAAIPKLIYPVRTGNDVGTNTSISTITFRYATAFGVYQDLTVNLQQLAVNFIPECMNPTPNGRSIYYSVPDVPITNQDVSNYYYYIYFPQSVQLMWNIAIKTLYGIYATNMLSMYGVTLDPTAAPYLKYDTDTNKFSMVFKSGGPFPQYTSDGVENYPRLEMFVDNYSYYILGIHAFLNNLPTTDYDIYLIKSIPPLSTYYIQPPSTSTYYITESDQSSLENWASLQKIIIEIRGDLEVQNLEYDSPAAIFSQYGNNNNSTFSKPKYPFVVDFEVNNSEWSVNSNTIQFTASSKEQVRLIKICDKGGIKDFFGGIKWVDIFGNRRNLYIPACGVPLTMKLALYERDFVT